MDTVFLQHTFRCCRFSLGWATWIFPSSAWPKHNIEDFFDGNVHHEWMTWGIFTPGQRKTLDSSQVPGSIHALYSIVCRNSRRSWGFYSILSAQLGCHWAAGSICLCSLLLSGPSGAVVAQAVAATTQVWQVCSCSQCFSCWAALPKQTRFSCLLKDAVALSTTMWSSVTDGMLSVPSCSYCSCCSSIIWAASLPIDQAVLRINQAPNRRALEY